MAERSEEKITKILLSSIAGAACAYGGFMSGWSKAQNIALEYETLMAYGPVLLSAGMFGAHSGLEAYAQAMEEPQLANQLSFAAKTAVGGAAMGCFLGSYNTLFFYVLGYGVGWMANGG